jgi:2-C-methyl-D-erythritol 4-phosphate cytidylyltransferase
VIAWAIVAAAGRGERLGAGVPKAMRPLDGIPIFGHSLRTLEQLPAIAAVVLVLPPLWLEHALSELPLIRRGTTPLELVEGAPTRQGSVREGLRHVPDDVDVVVVHDAARPLASAHLFEAALAGVATADGTVCAVPVTDTLNSVAEDGSVTGVVGRRGLWRAQTPQAFRRVVLIEGHERAARDGYEATDDAALVARIGARVVVVPGDERNIKITTTADLALAEALLRSGV